MMIGLKISYEIGALEPDFFRSVIKYYLKFTPYAFSKGNKTYEWNEGKFFKALTNYCGDGRLSVYDLNRNIISFGTTGTCRPHLSISIEEDDSLFFPTNEEVSILISHDGFISSYLFDENYTYVQSTPFENNFTGLNFQDEILNSVKNTPYEIGVFDNKEYDIRFNPGRSQLIQYTFLMAAWKMWFGKEFFKIVSKEKILSFPHAIKIAEVQPDLVYVQLFDRVDQSHTPDSMLRQWKWRDWLNYDDLEKMYV
ncbi:MAG: hypothetical protein ACO1OO_11445 [Flavisolibacter sp.]